MIKMMKKNRIGIVFLMILLTSVFTLGLDYKTENGIENSYGNFVVDWEHTKNNMSIQEYELTVTSDISQTVSPSLILSEYTKEYSNIHEYNFRVYHVVEQITYDYYTKWCTDYTYTDCSKNNNESYTINGGSGEEEVINVIETLMPISASQIKENNDYFEFDLNDMLLNANVPKKYRIEFHKFHEKNDYGVFSIKINNHEFWDKTHSSDFLINDQIFYYKFNGNANDETPNNNDGVATSPSTVTGIIDNCYNFSGGSNKVVPPSGAYTFGSDSISLWFKTPSSTTDIILSDYNAGKSDQGVNYVFINNGDIGFRIKTGSAKTYSASLDDNQWHHLVLNSNISSNQAELYIDGVKVDNVGIGGGSIDDNSQIGLRVDGALPFKGLIDEVGVWSRPLNDSEIRFLYNNGTPTTAQQYPYPKPVTTYNTSLQMFHDNITNVIIGSSTYATIYSLTESFGSTTNMTITIPVTIEKLSGTQSNIVYYRTLLDGNPINEEMIISLPQIGDVRSAFYNSFFQVDSANHTIEIQARRTGNGNDNISTSDINLYTGLTSNGTLINGLTEKIDIDVTVTGDYVNITNLTLPFGSNNNTFVWFVGTIENTASTNKNDIGIRFHSDTENSDTLIRSVDTDIGSLFINRMFYTDDTNIYLQGNGSEDFTIKGYFYVFDFVDSTGGIIGTEQIQDIDTNITNITLNSNLIGSTSSLSYYPTSSGTMDYRHYLFDKNTTSFYYSELMSRTFTNTYAGVVGVFHEFTDIPLNNVYELGVDYTTTATGTPQYFNLLMVQGQDLNFTFNTTGSINVTVNEANNSFISSISGSCVSEFLIGGVTINDTNFVFSGDFDNFVFTYTGSDVSNLPVTITCFDQYVNTDTVSRVYNIDTTKPTCTGIQNEFLVIPLNDTNINYTFNINCNDNLNLSRFVLSCDNNYFENISLSNTTFSYTNTTIFNNTGTVSCNYNITDQANNYNAYSNIFTITKESSFQPTLVFGTCPTGDTINILWVGVVLALVLIGFAVYHDGLFNFIGLVGGVMLVFIGLYYLACSPFIGALIGIVGAVISLIFVSKPTTYGA